MIYNTAADLAEAHALDQALDLDLLHETPRGPFRDQVHHVPAGIMY